jgi:hypothetical protein
MCRKANRFAMRLASRNPKTDPMVKQNEYGELILEKSEELDVETLIDLWYQEKDHYFSENDRTDWTGK